MNPTLPSSNINPRNNNNITFKFKRHDDDDDDDDDHHRPLDVSSSSSSPDHSKQIVLYSPPSVPEPHRPPALPFRPSSPLPAVGAFTIQCANCFKWRLIPTKDTYEAIRAHILEQPFFCETTARQWSPLLSCDDPPDISPDGTRMWAIDKPNIALPPPGWQRLLHIRGQGSSKFADVYYVAPSGKRLRSMVEIEKFLLDHPEFMRDGLNKSQFSFQTPRPLQDNYVRKRPRPRPRPLPLPPGDENRPPEPDLVRPLAWAIPDESTRLQLGMPQLTPPFISEYVDRSAKRPASGTSKKAMYSSDPRFNTDGLDRS